MDTFRQLRGMPTEDTPTTNRIVVPVAGNDSDTRLLTAVEKIARKQRAVITLIYVVEVPQSLPLDAELPHEVDTGERVLAAAESTLTRNLDRKISSVETELLQARSAGAAVVDEAIVRDADTVMMSAQIYRRHGILTIGETVEYVMNNAPCEVVVFRAPMPAAILETLEIELE